MKKIYDHKKIETKWQKEWDKKKIYQAKNKSKAKKFYSLIEFPYPSGAGLHVGHIRSNTAMDIISRKRRMEGYNVLYPIGWDAFGLPTESYAIKTGIPPARVTKDNTDTFRRQLKALGFSFDWSREINTTDPTYYKWTQWIFLQMYKKGLAYKKKTTINWCPKDKIGLANEEVIDGKCERCGAETTKKEKEQWMLAITKYADRLDEDLDDVDYLENIKIQQRNWIGKSEGSEIEFPIKDRNEKIKVFTTRADTIFGATYVVLAPEHELVNILKEQIENKKEVEDYINKVKIKTDIERTEENKEKTGVELKGILAINPANKENIKIWIADYVLSQYGTGAVMAVPAHDDRDFLFAKKYNLEIKQSIMPLLEDKENPWVDGKPITERKVVHVVLRRKDGKILILDLKGDKWINKKPVTLIIGGVEQDESLLDAAKREVLEEVGFKNIKLNEIIPISTQAKFYAAHKEVNRTANVTCLVFDLINEEKNDVSDDEKKNHDYKFVTIDEASKLINIPDDSLFISYLKEPKAYTSTGVLINSAKFDGLTSEEAKTKITEFIGGKIVTKYKLRDWIFSRQRYWGEPIPLIHCEKCGWIPVPEKELPVVLPKVKSYEPTDNGESPLANIKLFVETKCPKCKGKARRETDTMPNWAGSSWYYLRYTDPNNKKEFANKNITKYWTPVDWYNGGMEHVTLHLLYSRFWHKFLYDLKLVSTKEPYKKRTAHGMILAEDGEKMSKSRGNVINPDEIVKYYGADTLRVYEMFLGPFNQTAVWNTSSIIGSRRFLERIWRIATEKEFSKTDKKTEMVLHKTIKKVGEDIEDMSYNTCISAMMVLVNQIENGEISKNDFQKFLQILSPFAPHITEEIFRMLGEKKTIHLSEWPKWDKKKVIDEEIKIAVQVNGKVRSEIMITKEMTEDDIKKMALIDKNVLVWVEGKEIRRFIYIKERIINIVV